jgi:hypothetical protein
MFMLEVGDISLAGIFCRAEKLKSNLKFLEMRNLLGTLFLGSNSVGIFLCLNPDF